LASRDEMKVAAEAPRILLDEVSISYATPRGRLLAVDRVSLAVDRAEFVVLVGPSGCGKSTILRAIAGLNAAESGVISVDGKKVDGPPEHIGFMFQRDTLLPWLTVRGNIERACRPHSGQRGSPICWRCYGYPNSTTPIRRSSPAACAIAFHWAGCWPTSPP
jgi:ABC-type Fe3+/spermidine/putrescine transport system ATPase subunit